MVNWTSVKFGSGASVAMPTEKTNTDNNPDPPTRSRYPPGYIRPLGLFVGAVPSGPFNLHSASDKNNQGVVVDPAESADEALPRRFWPVSEAGASDACSGWAR